MPERDSHRQQVRKLLAQDQEINETQSKEFRMQLELSLQTWEEKTKTTRRRILIAVAVYIVGFFMCGLMVRLWPIEPHNLALALVRNILYLSFIVSALAAALIGILLAILYVFKYSPALQRIRFELQTAMILELQQQVAEMREEMKRSSG